MSPFSGCPEPYSMEEIQMKQMSALGKSMYPVTSHAKNLRKTRCASYTLERNFRVQWKGNKPSSLSGVPCEPESPEHVLTLLLQTSASKRCEFKENLPTAGRGTLKDTQTGKSPPEVWVQQGLCWRLSLLLPYEWLPEGNRCRTATHRTGPCCFINPEVWLSPWLAACVWLGGWATVS